MFQEYHALPVQTSIIIPRHCRTNDGHVFVVAMVIRAIFYEIPTDQLIEVLKNLIARVVKSNAMC